MDVATIRSLHQPNVDAYARYSGFLNEFRRWDAAFENVRGTYPSPQFAGDFVALTTRYRDSLERDMKKSSTIAPQFREHAKRKLWHEYAYGPSSMAMSLPSMAKYRVAFGSGSDRRNWASELDRTVEQLIVGVQMLSIASRPQQPGPIPLPSPTPQPNPYPNPGPYPGADPYPAPAPWPSEPVPAPWPNDPYQPAPNPPSEPVPGDS